MRETVLINGTKREIRADYRMILAVIRALNHTDLLPQARIRAALKIFYVDFDDLNDYPAAHEAMVNFLDFGKQKKDPYRLIDLEKDLKHIIAAVNKSAGQPIRNIDFLHIEDFLGYLQERDPESTISHIINIRYAMGTGKLGKLFKEHPQYREFFEKNKDDIIFEQPEQEPFKELTAGEQAEIIANFRAMRG